MSISNMARKLIFLFALLLFGFTSIFSQQRMDVDGDGYPETVFQNPGASHFHRIEFDFNRDGRNDIALILDENTGEFLSIDVVRTTWPIPSNIGSQQWINEKRSAAQLFWNNRAQNTAICDVCHITTAVNRNNGYILSSQDILANINYVNLESNPFFLTVESKLLFWQLMFQGGGIDTDWLLCDNCINEWIAALRR